MIGVVGTWLFTAAQWIEREAEITLPPPTGVFQVGRSLYDWTSPDKARELLVWIWYPASSASGPAADYVPPRMQTAMDSDTGPLLRFFTRDLAKVHIHSLRDVPLSPAQRAYPVLILRAGGSGPVVGYSALAEDLASHGYVVVGIDAPGLTKVVVFPDGRVIRRSPGNDVEDCADSTSQSPCVNGLLTAWTSHISFAVDQLARWNASDPSGKFTGRLDLNRLGLFGHSFGGAQAAQFCHDDPRCKAGVDIDGLLFGSVVPEGLHQPFMFLLSGQIDSPGKESRMFQTEIHSIYDRLPPDRRRLVEIRGANHFFFGDDGAFLKSHLVLRALRSAGIVGIDGPRQLAITSWLVRAFFDDHLTHLPPHSDSSPHYPELELLD